MRARRERSIGGDVVMLLRRGLACGFAAAAAWTAAQTAVAEGPPEKPWGGFVEGGAYYGDDAHVRYGEYTGLGQDQWNALGNFELWGQPAWDSGETWHFRVRGDNLGLDSRYLSARGGIQGVFDGFLVWDQIPHLLPFANSELVFNGRGTDLLTLPPNWVPATTTAGFRALPQDLSRLNMQRQRNDLRAGTNVELPAGFSLETRYKWDHQTGRKPIGSVIGNSGGNPRAVIVPEPIDYITNNGDVVLRYADHTKQGELGYEISHFNDENDSLTWQNPFSAISGWAPVAGYPTGFGRRGMAPDNIFHQVKASGGYDLPYNTRIMTHAAFGWMLQDANFLPYTDNPGLSVTTPLPRDSLDGKIETRNAGVRITSRPIEHLRAVAEWNLDDRDNDTPRDTYIYPGGDSQNQGTITSANARVNLPNGYRSNTGRAEVGYEFYERSELSVSYKHQEIQRDWTEVKHVSEDTFAGALHSRPIQQVDVRVDGSYANRNASNYFWDAPLVWGFSPEHVATLQPIDPYADFENHPLLRKYTLADRTQGKVGALVTVTPIDQLSLSSHIAWTRQDFSDSSYLGLRDRHAITWGLDASWTPIEALTTYAYYTRETSTSHQWSRSFNNTLAQAYNPNRNWNQYDDDLIDTVGAGVEWTAIPDRLTLRADLSYSQAEDKIDVATGPALAHGSNLPVAKSNLLDVGVQAEVKIIDHLKARAGYLFESLDQSDWAFDMVGPATIPEVLSLGSDTLDYNAHVVSFSLEYDF